MHKKLLWVCLIMSILFITSACSKPVEEEQKVNAYVKTYTLSDSKLGFTTTFELTYDSSDEYSDVIEEDSEKVTITLEEENAELVMEYLVMNIPTYNATETNAATTKNYKEYTFGDYEAFLYGNEEAKLNILLGLDDEKAETIVVQINSLDKDEKIDAKKIIEKKEINDFFNSMEFVKE